MMLESSILISHILKSIKDEFYNVYGNINLNTQYFYVCVIYLFILIANVLNAFITLYVLKAKKTEKR